MRAKSFSYRSNVTSLRGDRLVWPPVKPPPDKYHRRKHPEPCNKKKTDSCTEMSTGISVCTDYHSAPFTLGYQLAELQMCSVRCCTETREHNGQSRTKNALHTINITLQTCHSISGCIQAARRAEKDEKYWPCGLPNGGVHRERSRRDP